MSHGVCFNPRATALLTSAEDGEMIQTQTVTQNSLSALHFPSLSLSLSLSCFHLLYCTLLQAQPQIRRSSHDQRTLSSETQNFTWD
ncbi:hypothetical protein LDENG_00204390 [Lucifuga dentata]|nr:hypothetical protein LDENG_00204390 [Lucifuga dentata]